MSKDMYRIRKAVTWIVFAFLVVSLEGCVFPHKSVSKPPGEGYGTVTYEYGALHKSARRELHYWDRQRKETVIWRYLSNQIVYAGNDLTLFHGYLTTGPDDPGGARRRSIERLFAAQGPGPVVDITDDIIMLWAKDVGTNSVDALRSGYINWLKQTNNAFEIRVGIRFGSVGTVRRTRDQIVEMISGAKKKGKLMKDPGFGTPYFKRDWKAELQM